MSEEHRIAHILTEPTDEGTFRAYCPEIEGISAVGETPDAAESVLTRLIETHMETDTIVIAHLDVVGDPNAVIGDSREDR